MYTVERTAKIDITFQIIDMKSGGKIIVKKYNKSKRSTVNRSYEKENDQEKIIGLVTEVLAQKDVESPSDKAKREALSSLPNPKRLLDDIMNDIIVSFINSYIEEMKKLKE